MSLEPRRVVARRVVSVRSRRTCQHPKCADPIEVGEEHVVVADRRFHLECAEPAVQDGVI